ncbi:unnamed protein product, partial [Ectocarpus fasciculatus]
MGATDHGHQQRTRSTRHTKAQPEKKIPMKSPHIDRGVKQPPWCDRERQESSNPLTLPTFKKTTSTKDKRRPQTATACSAFRTHTYSRLILQDDRLTIACIT